MAAMQSGMMIISMYRDPENGNNSVIVICYFN